MSTKIKYKPIRVAILQRFCTAYRVALFRKLSLQKELRVKLLIGENLSGGKARTSADLSGIDVEQLPTRWLKLGGRYLPDHKGLLNALSNYNPDVILCEGESNALNNIKILFYRRRHPYIGLVHWSLGEMPGIAVKYRGFKGMLKRMVRNRFDSYIVYSSYGRNALVKLGHKPEKIFVAVNVGDTSKHLNTAGKLRQTQIEARQELNLPNRFTVTYVGAITPNKRLDKLILAAAMLAERDYTFILAGDGPILSELRSLADKHHLHNIITPGRITQKLPLYYRASDVSVLPGRGGIVISEAMAYSLPVIVYQADGTEYDLVQDGINGIRLTRGDPEEIAEALESLRKNPERTRNLGAAGNRLLREKYLQENMVLQITEAIKAVSRRADLANTMTDRSTSLSE